MQSDSANSATKTTSFFDDDDLTLGFAFQKPTIKNEKDLSSPPKISSKLLRQLSPSESLSQGYYALHDKTLVYYKSGTSQYAEGVLSLVCVQLRLLAPGAETTCFGFELKKNGIKYEFHAEEESIIENWMTALKNVCVLHNFHDEYKAVKMIGKGSFAKVYLVESKTTGKNFAVKAFTKESLIISNKSNAKPSMINEIEIMRVLDHENVIKLYEVYETERSIYLVLELIQGKSLQDTLKKSGFKDNEARTINVISSIIDALAYLASKGIMHRDLKPDNILLDKGDKVKIVDFGLATIIDIPEYIFKKCGTPGYIAPEVFKYDQKNPNTNYDDRCDAFSAGCILFYMIFGFLFFDGPNASEILKTNRKFTADFQTLAAIKDELKSPTSKISKEALDLMVKLLEFDPKHRMTAAQALNHPFLFSVMQQKLAGSFDVYQNGGYSPAFYDRRNSLAHDGAIQQQIKSGAVNSPQRFGEKDSLYLDYGKPEINGKVDTITSGSHNNSLLLTRADSSNTNSQPNSAASSFAKNSQRSGSFKVHNSGGNNNQSFLKAAIFRNMQQKNSNEEEKDESASPQKSSKTQERRYSDFVTNKINPYGNSDTSPKDDGSEMEEQPKLLPHEGKVKRSSKLVGSPVKGQTGYDRPAF